MTGIAGAASSPGHYHHRVDRWSTVYRPRSFILGLPERRLRNRSITVSESPERSSLGWGHSTTIYRSRRGIITRGRLKAGSPDRRFRDRCKLKGVGLPKRPLSGSLQHYLSMWLPELPESPQQQQRGIAEVFFRIGPQYNLFWKHQGMTYFGITASSSISGF